MPRLPFSESSCCIAGCFMGLGLDLDMLCLPPLGETWLSFSQYIQTSGCKRIIHLPPSLSDKCLSVHGLAVFSSYSGGRETAWVGMHWVPCAQANEVYLILCISGRLEQSGLGSSKAPLPGRAVLS